LRATDAAGRVLESERAPVAVGVVREHNPRLRGPGGAPGMVSGERGRQVGAPVVGVAKRGRFRSIRCSSAPP
jgi:hypothetical protein